MREWCESTRNHLASMFLRGKITHAQFMVLANAAQGFALRAEAWQYDWGTIEAQEKMDELQQAMGVAA